MVFFPFLSNIATGFCCLAYCSTAYRRPQIRRRPETISRLLEPARWDGHRTPTVHREGCAIAQAYLRVRIADPAVLGWTIRPPLLLRESWSMDSNLMETSRFPSRRTANFSDAAPKALSQLPSLHKSSSSSLK